MAFLSPTVALAWCLAQTLVVIGSLYVFVPRAVRALDREDELQIKHRIAAFIIATVTCTCGTCWLLPQGSSDVILFQGLSLTSTLWPLLRFLLLFSGQWVQVLCFPKSFGDEQQFNIAQGQFWVNFRNLVFAPLPEELIFRSLMGSTLMRAGFSRQVLLFGTPLFFGLAHVHLSVVKFYKTRDATVILACLFQVAYTTLFGALMMQVLLDTENLLAIVLVHCFCNLMGFPNLMFWKDKQAAVWEKGLVACCFATGIAGYVVM